MAREYLSHSDTAGTTASLGWYVEDGGRVADPPSPRQYVIDSIPYRSGEIDVSDAFGIGPTYPMRELEYRLIGKFASNAAAHTASDSLGACTYVGATCSADVEIDSSIHGSRTVTVQLTAQPYTKGGSL